MSRQKISEELSNKFANMAIVCAVLVVFIHLPANSAGAGVREVSGYLSRGVAKMAVPYFFLAAGFFLAGRIGEEGWYRRAICSRVKSLLVPMFIWNVFWLLWEVGMTALADLRDARPLLGGLNMGWGTVWRVSCLYPFAQPSLYPTWFVRALFVLVVLSPLFVRHMNLWLVVSLWIANGLIHPDYGVDWTPMTFTLTEGYFSIFGAAYFCLGIWLRSNVVFLADHLRFGRYGWLALLAGVALLLCRGVMDAPSLGRLLTWFYIPVLMAGVWSLIPSAPTKNFFISMAFPIYIMHPFVLSFFDALTRNLHCSILEPNNLNGLTYCIWGFACVFLCVAIAWGVRKFLPRTFAMLFGGR